jgi:hypothetical protein
MDPLADVPERLRDDLNGFQSADIAHIDSGMSVGGPSFNADFDVGGLALRRVHPVQPRDTGDDRRGRDA